MVIFGTRPEVIKLAPVLRALRQRPGVRVVTVATSQQADLLPPFLRSFAIQVDHDLNAMVPGQSLNQLLARIAGALDPVLRSAAPDLAVVQGDTTSALAGALAARLRHVPVAHVEAGLRSGDVDNPYPEEINRTLITHMAALHCAPTQGNVDTLVGEGIDPAAIVLTGNPVVDSLEEIRAHNGHTDAIDSLMRDVAGKRMVLLTNHRRESFGTVMVENLRVIRAFIERHDDLALVFPVHPNPSVQAAVDQVMAGAPPVHLLKPLDYPDFLHLFKRAWLVLSDSGGVQEEAPTIGKPVLVMRKVTERPEAITCGIARLAGTSPAHLAAELDEAVADGSWVASIGPIANPFGDGHAGERIADAIVDFVHGDRAAPVRQSS